MSEWLNARLIVIAAAGVSAGIHAGLVPDHYDESRTLGILFALAAAGLAVVATALALWPDWTLPPVAAVAMFAALLVAYVVARDDPFDTIAGVSKAVEALGLAGAFLLLRRRPATRPGDLALAYFGLTFALAFIVAASAGHGH